MIAARRLAPLLLAVALPLPLLPAQNIHPLLQITEVLLDPFGPNAGAQVVEVTAISNQQVDTMGMQLAAGGALLPFPAVTLPPGATARLHLGVAGTSTFADLFFATAPLLTASGTLAIFRNAPSTQAQDLVDFVAWGGGTAFAQQAIQAGRWLSAVQTPPAPREGATLAHRVWAAGNAPIGALAFYEDTTPTLGLPNDPGMTFHHQPGCAQPAWPPQLGVPNPADPGPWLGEAHLLLAGFLPQPSGVMFVVAGTLAVGPQSLAPVGMPGCVGWFVPANVFAVWHAQGTATFGYYVPQTASLVGLQYYFQALVPDPAAGNALGALVTNSLVCIVGSR